MKLNHMIDKEIIDGLYAASRAGVPIDLIIRSTCGLMPGVPGLSENIRVRSIVGRFLEHSRIYRFGAPDHPAVKYLIGSADLMPRNLSGRVEALTPVESPLLQQRLEDILQIELADDTLAWELAADGTWSKVKTAEGVDTHAVLAQHAAERSRVGRA
jgi:polyphosphate kinase